MNLHQRFHDLRQFLLAYQNVWENEIMLLYPDPLRYLNPEWVEELARFDDLQDMVELERKNVSHLLTHPGLLDFFHKIQSLVQVDTIPSLPAVPATAKTWLHMIPKKEFEIKCLAPLIHHYQQRLGHSKIVDIGGGQGFLAQTLAHRYNLDVLSLDMDEVLQRSGDQRQQEKLTHGGRPVRFHPLKLERHSQDFAKLLDQNTLTTGLHTCGTLAVSQLDGTLASKSSAVNMPCCYHKLSEGDFNLSSLAKEAPLELNDFSLTLASRAHRKFTEKDVKLKAQVKRYRYTLHMLLYHELNMNEHLTLGNCPPALYWGDFATYAREQLRRLKLTLAMSDNQLNHFYAEPTRQKLIWQMIAACLIRDALGRPLEMYLLLDRMLWLEEHNYRSELLAVFDDAVSPRNLAMIAWPCS